jgi:hypothetical protein
MQTKKLSSTKPAVCDPNRGGHGLCARTSATVNGFAPFFSLRSLPSSLQAFAGLESCITILIPAIMSQSSASVVQDVVDRLVLTGTVYDDLIRTLRRRPLSRVDHAAEEESPAAGWTSSELLVELPSLRAFFRSNPTFPPSYVLASCPNVQGRTTPDATVRYYYQNHSAAADVKQKMQDQAAVDDNDDEHQVEEDKENKIDVVQGGNGRPPAPPG